MSLSSGRYCCSDLVERRIGNFIRLNLRSAFEELTQVFHNFWIAGPGVGVESEMTTYTIDNENNITAHSSEADAGDAQGERFAKMAGLSPSAEATLKGDRGV
jgi:hypothetical protein